MIKLLVGQPGSGKTKQMLKNANSSIGNVKGNILFIGESNDCQLQVNHDIRFLNITDFPIDSSNEFVAFLHGLMSSNYDYELMYLDGILNLYIMTPEEICSWLNKIKILSEKHNIKFEISISINTEIPDCLKEYM